MKIIGHRIGGDFIKEENSRFGNVFNPATGEVESKVALASTSDVDKAVDYYKKAVKTSDIGDHLFQFKLNLLYLYYNEKNYADYTSLIDDIDIDEIKSFQLKSKYEQLPDIN